MARKEVVQFVDDIDGSEARGTVKFALDGSVFEIDLSESNEVRLREALSPFLEAGREKARTLSRTSSPASGSYSKADLKRIREWARENGYPLNKRGRIPNTVLEAYHTGAPSPTAGAQDPRP